MSRENYCEHCRKVLHATHGAAARSIRQRRIGRDTGVFGKVHPYRCPAQRGWHVGHERMNGGAKAERRESA